MENDFKPMHINATSADFLGNNKIGRYVFLPGSNGRAKKIAEHFSDLNSKEHVRGHHLYLGNLNHNGKKIAVACISSGMGCPSMEIILHELYHLGAKRFLRVGTAGSLQPETIKVGDLVNAIASVRDESTTQDYLPPEFPAVSSPEFNLKIAEAYQSLDPQYKLHSGIIHCKSSFYAREYIHGPLSESHKQYLQLLNKYGVLASEMETAALFVQSRLYDHELQQKGSGPEFKVFASAILSVMGSPLEKKKASVDAEAVQSNLIQLALQSVVRLAESEMESF
jgi:uridine phosphorylase